MEEENEKRRRILLTVAYDGTNYHGWQLQPGKVTIESELNRALTELLGTDTQVIGASRTDSGVHALGNAAVFDAASKMPTEKFPYALNARLPEDIRIQNAREVAPDFHPRHTKSRKTYEYRIYHAPFAMPTKRLYSYFIYGPLDVEAMARAGELLQGEHDFKSFCSVHTQVLTTVRTISRVEVREEADGREVVISVTGNGFLYNMVRIIAGTLLEVGQGKRAPEDMRAILDARDRVAAGPTAPAHGLTLIAYDFMDPCFMEQGSIEQGSMELRKRS